MGSSSSPLRVSIFPSDEQTKVLDSGEERVWTR
jgi:hypothetical protein